MLEENCGAQWARTSNLWIPSLTRSLLSYVGRYVEWYLNLLTTLDSNVPHKTTRSRVTNPWMNTKTRRLTRQKNRAFIKAKSSKNTRDTRRYKKLKTACQRSIREAHDTYVHDVIGQSAQENPKKFWSYIKGKKQESSGVSPLRNVDGVIHSEANVKANILNRQFVSVFTKEDTANIPDKGASPYASMEGITVTPNGATRNTTRINVGLARSYVKLLLSSWKTYMCNLMAWYINK